MKYNNWTDEEEKKLREMWGKKTVKEIAKLLGRTYQSVYGKSKRINLGPNGIRKGRWTNEEEIYLINNWGVKSVDSIAKSLDKSKKAVMSKKDRLELGPFLESGDYISLNQIMGIIRNSNKGAGYTMNQWIDKGLPVKIKKVNKSSARVVDLDELWKWAEENRTIIDFSAMEPLSLGKEPGWLKEQRKADKKRLFFKSTPWTKQEDEYLELLVNMFKYGYREISFKLRRTEGAIKRRLLDKNIPARPIKKSNHNPWSKKETDLLIDLYNKGYCRNTFPFYINRSSQACSGKIERLIEEGIINPRSEFRTSC